MDVCHISFSEIGYASKREVSGTLLRVARIVYWSEMTIVMEYWF